jgi:signal transduction histidine kinase
MENIIDDTLTLAREGLTVDECEAVALSPLIESCMAVTDATPATVDIDTDCTIMGDPDRLAHVFENLCQNAVDHAGPEVTVTIGTMADGFYVADDGPGIPPEDRETVFEPGYTTRKGGTGLGLRIVQRIVDAHGWEISVTDSESGGARFEITGVNFR